MKKTTIGRLKLKLIGTAPLASPWSSELAWSHCVPTLAIKKALVDANQYLVRTDRRGVYPSGEVLRGTAFIEGHEVPVCCRGVPYTDKTAHIEEVPVRIGRSEITVRSIRVYDPWEVEIAVRYHRGLTSIGRLLELFEVAGDHIGLGRNRPQRDGTYGTFYQTQDLKVRKAG